MFRKNPSRIVLSAAIFLAFSSAMRYHNLRKLFNHPGCDCYLKPYSYSCHCQDKVHVELGIALDLSIAVKCDNGTGSGPYQFASKLYFDYLSAFSLGVRGCSPPEREFSSILPKRLFSNAENVGSIRLSLHCDGLQMFSFRSHHLQNLRYLKEFSINCPPLSNIPDDLFRGTSETITALDITNTSLKYLPQNIFSHFLPLRELHLTNNKLKAVPSLASLTKLKTLDISGNQIDQLDENIFVSTKNVNMIILNRNRLSLLPSSLCTLVHLRYLEAEDNRLQFIDLHCLTLLRSIWGLKFSGNNLLALERNVVPKGMFINSGNGVKTPNKSTVAATTPLNSNPNENEIAITVSQREDYHNLFHQTNIHPLNFDCSNNNLSWISENVFSAVLHFGKVDLSFNRISVLPETLFRFTDALEELNLSNNLISNISENFFSGLQTLSKIDLSHNAIEHLPENIFLPLEGASLFLLSLEGNRLSSLPILLLPRLKELNLARNRLERISLDALKHLHALKRIDLSFNFIQTTEPFSSQNSEFTGNLFHTHLTTIEHIDFSYNRLTKHPNVTEVGKTLVSLNLSGNIFEELSLNHCTNLKALDLSNNSLQNAFRVEYHILNFIHMYQLVHLDLSRNGISFVGCLEYPAGTIERCDSFLLHAFNLEELNLAYNEIDEMPEYFSLLPNLRHVDLRYNKIKAIFFNNFFYVNGILNVNHFDSEKNYVKTDDYYELPNTRHLEIDLRHNEITHVDLPETKMELVPQDCNVDKRFAHATILMGHNPILCGCQIYRLLQYSQKEIRPVAEDERFYGKRIKLPVKVSLQDLYCRKPLSVRGKRVFDPETWMHHLLPLLALCKSRGSF
ncbi:chaoptin-like [Ischnura elegans]|uniref:chaoptin-like n=1 Tax=Ischnura elegans TaxID=197161 RepID=UPI001ED86BB5|nr:chaoptin-like [Ischnura elegans]